MRVPAFLALFLVLATSPALATQEESLEHLLRENEIRLTGLVADHGRKSPVLVIVETSGDSTGLRSEFFAELVRHKLTKVGVRSEVYSETFRNRFRRHGLDISDVLAPKLVVEINSTRNSGNRGYLVEFSLFMAVHKRRSATEANYVGEILWSSHQQLRVVAADELEDAVGQHVRKQMDEMLRDQKPALLSLTTKKPSKSNSNAEGSESTSPDSNANARLSYKLRWNDPDGRRDRFFLGGAVGTPALLNLSVGYWGSRSFPVLAGISGMYYTSERRGLQGELGWIFDNQGSIRQVVSLVGAAFNGTRQVVSQTTDEFGRVTSRTTDSFNELHPYFGSAYTIQWNDFRLQAGAAFRADSSSEPVVRFLIQLGFTPALRF